MENNDRDKKEKDNDSILNTKETVKQIQIVQDGKIKTIKNICGTIVVLDGNV